MAKSVTLESILIPSGQFIFSIDTLPANSRGFLFVLGRDATWLLASEVLFSVTLDIALDGVNFQRWMACSVKAGAALNRNGSPATIWVLEGTWPGENDGFGGRRALIATNVRITLTVPRSFSVSSVNLRSV
jgi:hypothetical protein